MNSAEKAQEPSMDEIIRSIRSIIADDSQSDLSFPSVEKSANPSASVLKLSEEQIAGTETSATAASVSVGKDSSDTTGKPAEKAISTNQSNTGQAGGGGGQAEPQNSTTVEESEERAPIPSTPSVALRRGATAEEITAALEAMTKLAVPAQAGKKSVSVVADGVAQETTAPIDGQQQIPLAGDDYAKEEALDGESGVDQNDQGVAAQLESSAGRDVVDCQVEDEVADPVEAMLREADQLEDVEDDPDDTFIDPLDNSEESAGEAVEEVAVAAENENKAVGTPMEAQTPAATFEISNKGAMPAQAKKGTASLSEQIMKVEVKTKDSHDATAVTAVAAATSEAMSGGMGSSMLPVAYGQKEGSRTLEDSVREMLKPLIREWLDKNMPRILEGAIKEEIEGEKD